MGALVEAFEYVDPFQNEQLDIITERVRELQDMGYFGDVSLDPGRARRARIDRSNPATARLIDWVDGVGAWLDLIPTAAALDLCYNPVGDKLPNGAQITFPMSTWACNLADTVGIRSRAAASQRLAVSHAIEGCAQQRWLSLACGAAHPVIDALAKVRETGGTIPRLDLVDLDGSALALARGYADAADLSGHVATHRMNILNRAGVAPLGLIHRLVRPLRRSYDLVEAIGLLEYLKIEDWHYAYNKVVRTRTVMAGARTFLRNAWALVKPGGLLIVGNMLDSHPQLGFTLNVLQWPHIQPRSVSEIMSLLDEANVDGERQVLLPGDGVYAIYAVRKPS